MVLWQCSNLPKNGSMSNDCEMVTKEFYSLVSSELAFMKSNNVPSVEQSILLSRIFNTISMNNKLLEIEQCKDFQSVFLKQYAAKCANILDAKLTKGLAYYSSKYDIYIGGAPNENSVIGICW